MSGLNDTQGWVTFVVLAVVVIAIAAGWDWYRKTRK